MALFHRRASLFGDGWSSRSHSREPVVGRGAYHSMLTPPSLPLFLIAVVLAAAALLTRYAHVDVPVVTPGNAFDVLAIGFAALLVGVLVPRL
jgi:hypothetical protein